MSLDMKKIVKEIVVLLANKKYIEILKVANSKLSADEIKSIVDDFAEEIITPDDDIFNTIDFIKIENSNQESYSVDFDLWTKESGLSDLTLQLTVTKCVGSVEIELDNIHVL